MMEYTNTNRTMQNTRQGDTMPCVRLDEKLRILYANNPAREAGIREGEFLPCPLNRQENAFLLLHETSLYHAEKMVCDALSDPQYAVRLHIADFHGFHVAYILYEYALSGNTATAFLFRSVRQSLAFVPHLSCEAARHAARLEAYFSRLREKCAALLKTPFSHGGGDSESFEELMSAALFAMRVFTPLMPEENDGGQMFYIGALLRTYCDSVLPSVFQTDCRIACGEGTDSEDISLSVDAAAMCLLWTTIVKILNDISDDRCIRISSHRFGRDCELRFSTVAERITAQASPISAPASLIPFLPSAQPLLLLIDYLSGIQNCFAEILTDTETSHLTVSLYIPAKKLPPDFKSPEEPRAFLKDITAVCKTILSLGFDM